MSFDITTSNMIIVLIKLWLETTYDNKSHTVESWYAQIESQYVTSLDPRWPSRVPEIAFFHDMEIIWNFLPKDKSRVPEKNLTS